MQCSSYSPPCAPSPSSPPKAATGAARRECVHYERLDSPSRGLTFAVCILCGRQRDYGQELDIDAPMRERNPRPGLADEFKDMNKAKARDRAQRRPWWERGEGG